MDKLKLVRPSRAMRAQAEDYRREFFDHGERAHLYLWDEPLNYIDLFSRIQLEELILRYRPTMLLVEHDRAFRDRVGTGSVTL